MNLRDTILSIKPFDAIEAKHIQDVIAWIDSGAPLYRIAKPDNPPKHLVSYFVLYDEMRNKLMLVDHVKAKLWLPAGGHVEPDEDPRVAVEREVQEELNINADFSTKFGDKPLFVTVTVTKGYGQHTDVSLWYVISGDSLEKLIFDEIEMNSYQWYTVDEIVALDTAILDPHMHRFVEKMQQFV